MTDQTSAAPAASEAAPVVSAPNLDGGESFTAEQAFEAYQKRNSPAASADDATAGAESAVEADAAPPGEVHGGDEEPDPAAEPPIERPKSWTEAEDAEWRATPRALQQKIVARELERDSGLRRAQNETAEVRKAVEAELTQAKDVRQKYDSQLPALMQALQDAHSQEFPDIKSMADVERIANGIKTAQQNQDPFTALELQNYLTRWNVHQQKMAAVKVELDQAEGRKSQERQSKRAAYEAEQNKLLVDLVPEMADPKKSVEIREQAVAMLTDDLGLKMDQLQRWMADDTGHEILSNAGIQKMIADRLKFNEVKAAPAKAIPKPVPSVQKPGVGRAPGAASADAIQASRQKLTSTGSPEDAFALYQAKKARAR